MINSDLYPAAPQWGREPLTDKARVVSTHRRVPANLVSGRTLQPSIVADSFVPSDFLADGQVSGLRTLHTILTSNFFGTWIFLFMFFFSSLILCTKPFGDGAMDDGTRLRIELAASSSFSARSRPWSDRR